MTARALAFRSALLALLVAASLGPSCTLPAKRVPTLLALDVSGSIEPAALNRVLGELQELDLPERLDPRWAAFADRLRPLEGPQSLSALAVVDEETSRAVREALGPAALDRAETDLEEALRSSVEILADRRTTAAHVVLLTDGADTGGALRRGDLEDLLARHSITVSQVALPSGAPALGVLRAQIESAGWTEAATTALALEVSAPRPGEARAHLAIGSSRTEHRAQLEAGRQWISLPATPEASGLQPLSLRLEQRGSPPARWRGTVDVGPRPRALFVSEERTPLPEILRRRGLEVVVRSPHASGSLSDLTTASWDLLLLAGVEAARWSADDHQRLLDWVRGGGALIFVGGEKTYGEEGWSATPTESILPVRFRVREQSRDVALMIALDKSYSMKGEKIELAKEATKAALGELEDEHRFGVVAFDWNSFDVVPLQPASERATIADLIGRIEASAQTNFYPALESCLRQLDAVEAEVKHVILISDGKTYPDDYEELLGRMRESEVTVSTVAVGGEADREMLDEIARWGKGQSYFVQDASRVQRILLNEARRKTDDTLVEEDLVVSAVGDPQLLRGLEIGSAPALLGAVSVEARPEAEVLLQSVDDLPLLSRRRVGLGQTWFWSSDVGYRWARPWLSWSGFAPLFQRIAFAAATPTLTPRLRFDVSREGSHVTLALDARHDDGSFDSSLRPSVVLSGAREDRVQLSLVSPGRYEGAVRLRPDPSGDVRFDLEVEGERRGLSSLYFPRADERLGADEVSQRELQSLVAATGGTVAPDLATLLPSLGGGPGRRDVPLRRPLLILALVLYLTELALHRTGRLEGPLPGAGAPVASRPGVTVGDVEAPARSR